MMSLKINFIKSQQCSYQISNDLKGNLMIIYFDIIATYYVYCLTFISYLNKRRKMFYSRIISNKYF